MNKRDFCRRAVMWVAAIFCFWALDAALGGEKNGLAADAGAYAAWKNGPGKDPGFFPIAVWLQDPKNAAKYKAIGINLYVGLWKGPPTSRSPS